MPVLALRPWDVTVHGLAALRHFAVLIHLVGHLQFFTVAWSVWEVAVSVLAPGLFPFS